MIVSLHKHLLYGNKGEMEKFFAMAQRAAFLEFIGLSHKKALELPDTAKIFLSAIKLAKQHFVHPKEAPRLDALKIAKTILSLHAGHEALLEEERLLSAEIARVAIFGDFSQADLLSLEQEGRRVLQFFCMKSRLARETTLSPELLFIGTEYDLDYFVGINKERTQYPKMVEIRIERSVGVLRERLTLVREELARTDADLRIFCNALPDLQHGLNECLNDYTLNLVKYDAATPLGDSLFAIEAWVPENKMKALYGLLSSFNIQAEEIAVEPVDRIPTCIENRGVLKVGEDLVHIYDVPAHTDKDPSGWVLCFFSLFFAMIISDAGYGLLYFILALLLQWKMPIKATGAHKRFVKLFLILSLSCIVWGVATASFFGVEIGPNNPFRKSSFIHSLAVRKASYHLAEKDDVYHAYLKDFPSLQEADSGHDFLMKTAYTKEGVQKYAALEDFYDNILLELSLVVGIIHLSLSLCRHALRNPIGLGWILFMCGGYLYFPTYLDATTMINFLGWVPKGAASSIGLQLLAIGPGLVCLIALLQKKKWMAIHELTNGIQIFSDVLSYLRLYALALAGMVMANTVNTTLGIDVGVVGSIAVILFGHAINLSLSTMSATIHGLRLNFLEWYRYSFEGGGRLFNPLRLRK
ncbi:MAG: V-type ATP synthase subunit I [Chlamydiia bacterium]|nr:V-type ATP synthase subunit I [Chlamydiia bacterium]